jgi:serine phosphatase RsbU (regulator of sigma subunit)
VGLIPGAEYESHTLELAPDDLLVLYTDGIWEAEDRAGEEFGRDRLAHAVLGARKRPSEEVVSVLREEWERFRDGSRHADDTTVIALRRVGSPSPRASDG